MHLLPCQIKKIRRSCSIILLCSLLFSAAYTQSTTIYKNFTSTITGKVIDIELNLYLGYVTIEMQEIKTNEVLFITRSDINGFFEIKNVPNNQYKLKFSFLGYRDTVIQISVLESSGLDVGTIALSSLAIKLSDVQVKFKKPIIEQDLDKIIYNVDADPESSTSTALEMLQKIPLLSIDAEDNIQLNGNSDFRVLVNGKPTMLFANNPSDVLNNMSASAIKTIEVITVPSSRYQAEGVGGIINIITYKKTISGYNGGVNVKGSHPKGYATNGNLTVTMGSFSLSANYGYGAKTTPISEHVFYRQDNIRRNRLEQLGTSTSNSWQYNGGGELTWALNAFNQLTAGYSMNRSKGDNNHRQQVSLRNAANALTEAYLNTNAGNNTSYGKDLVFDYQRNFKKNQAQQLMLSYRRSNSTASNNSNFYLQPFINYKERSSTTSNNDELSEQSFQADLFKPVKNHTLEIGIGVVSRYNNSDYFYKNRDSSSYTFVLDTNKSNNYHYRESIYSTYSSYNLRFNKWSMRMGVRMEQATLNASFISSRTNAKQKYLNLIPSIILSRQLKGISMMKLSYTQRIQRPSLNYLNPYIDLTDPKNISFGNPQLQPAVSHVFNLAHNTYVKKTSLNVSITYQFTKNAIQAFTTLGADTIAYTTFKNIGKHQNSSLHLSSNTTFFKKLSFNLAGTLNYIQYSSNINSKPYTSNGLTYNVSAAVALRLKSWSAGRSISYCAPNILAQGRTASYVSNNITVNKYFFKNKRANMGLSVSSPFRKYRQSSTEITDPYFRQWRESTTLIRRFNLSINYRFNKLQTGKPADSHK